MPENKTILSSIPVIGGLVDTVIGGIFQGGQNKKNRQFAEKMYNRQRADSLADWNMNNQYNSAGAQMARLKEAGLNPNLVYGNGGSVMQAATVRSADMEYGKGVALPGTRLGETLAQSQQLELVRAQTSNVQAQTEVARADEALKTAQAMKTLFEGHHSDFDLQRKEELKRIIFEQGVASLDLTKANIDASVHGNQRAQQLQPKLLKAADLDAAGKTLDNAMKQMQNGQFENMRPLELSRLKAEIDRLLESTKLTKQQTKNEEQITKINKIEANAGAILRTIRGIVGTVKGK